jgi:mercuric ion transport protein
MARRDWRGYLLIASALLTCPCHLPVLAALLAGTAVGGLLTQHMGLLLVGLTAYFGLALWLGLRWLKPKPAPLPPPLQEARR